MPFVYLMANRKKGVIYTGVTKDLVRRIYEHKNKVTGGFTKKYDVNRLVYYEVFDSIVLAIEREKQIKARKRSKKVELIEQKNPMWEDLYDEILK